MRVCGAETGQFPAPTLPLSARAAPVACRAPSPAACRDLVRSRPCAHTAPGGATCAPCTTCAPCGWGWVRLSSTGPPCGSLSTPLPPAPNFRKMHDSPSPAGHGSPAAIALPGPRSPAAIAHPGPHIPIPAEAIHGRTTAQPCRGHPWPSAATHPCPHGLGHPGARTAPRSPAIRDCPRARKGARGATIRGRPALRRVRWHDSARFGTFWRDSGAIRPDLRPLPGLKLAYFVAGFLRVVHSVNFRRLANFGLVAARSVRYGLGAS